MSELKKIPPLFIFQGVSVYRASRVERYINDYLIADSYFKTTPKYTGYWIGVHASRMFGICIARHSELAGYLSTMSNKKALVKP
jgi:hypothetical protein